MDTLTGMRTYAAVVDTGSFTQAAERLGLSKALTSKYVGQLEEHLGVRLLNRTTRRLSVTEVGQAYYQHCRQLLDDLDELEAAVRQQQASPQGQLRVAAPLIFGEGYLTRTVADYLREQPGVSVELVLADRFVDIVDEGFDLAVRIGRLADSSLIARRLGPCRHVLCASPGYLEKHGTPRTPEDLTGHRTLSYGYHDTPREWRMIAPDGRYLTVPVNSTVHMNNSLALREAILNDAGIVLIPTFIVGSDLQAGRLQKVLPAYRLQERKLPV